MPGLDLEIMGGGEGGHTNIHTYIHPYGPWILVYK